MRGLPARTERKIMKHGSSGVIAIPLDYRKYHDLHPGKRVIVLYDSLLLIIPEDKKHILEDPEKKKLIDKILE